MAIQVSQDMYNNVLSQRDSHRSLAANEEQQIQAAMVRRDQATQRADDFDKILAQLEVA